ncbi:MAG TPA: polyribonucleotide nucleotidyltransferase [Acidimicrobiales bacterium]|nr:polyribonucleotide nucleotidyltransferase [Acidimicrobiales bacterium]
MGELVTVSVPVSGTAKSISFETGLLAQQSQGAVVGRVGDTVVLATANAAHNAPEGIDFFPLTVDVEERMYAAGKIPGSFFRREGRPTESAILTARLIDRPLRPSFVDGYRNETQVVVTVLGADQVNPHDIIAINAASAALMISGIPFENPIGAVRVAYSQQGQWVPHPTYEEGDGSTFELVVAGRALPDGDIAIMMVEAGGAERAWSYYEAGAPKVTEEVIAEGLEAAKTWIRESIELQLELKAKAGPRTALVFPARKDYEADVYERVEALGGDRIAKVTTISLKSEREAALSEVAAALLEELGGDFPGREKEIANAVRSLTKRLVRKRIVEEGVRIDGRGTRDLRPLSARVGVIPTAHGSGLFQRGETQVLNVATLGMPRSDQLLDTISPEEKKRYMHHYNMPPFANGEVGRVGSPKRREIGHGLLAERALLPVVPAYDEFPYALRLVSEVLSSNGSTSMASVCASTLSLMDAGVPIKAPVAGIAMGLVKEGERYVTLTDILGAEDAFGDMDFKVAGPADFVTALQLDTKIDGLPAGVLADALRQAREARLTILEVMNGAISEPRTEVRDTAPKIVTLEIPIDKIGEVIGPKGKMINSIQQETGTDISVDDDGVVGTVTVGARDGGAVKEAVRRIELILDPPKAEIGSTYTGKVVNITKFGAFVNILPGRDGLVHISKLSKLTQGKRVERVEDVLSVGEELEVRVDDIDPVGKVSLSLLAGSADEAAPGGSGAQGGSADRAREERGHNGAGDPDYETVSFEETWEQEARSAFGDLGPVTAPELAAGPALPGARGPGSRSGENRGGDQRGGEQRGSGPRRNPRRRR